MEKRNYYIETMAPVISRYKVGLHCATGRSLKTGYADQVRHNRTSPDFTCSTVGSFS